MCLCLVQLVERLCPANLYTACLSSRLAFTPAELRVAATSSPADTLRLVRITRAPACAKARAVSTPMPELPPDQHEAGIVEAKYYCRIQSPVERVTAQIAPVTTAVFPVRSAPLSACTAVVRDPSTGAMKSFCYLCTCLSSNALLLLVGIVVTLVDVIMM